MELLRKWKGMIVAILLLKMVRLL